MAEYSGTAWGQQGWQCSMRWMIAGTLRRQSCTHLGAGKARKEFRNERSKLREKPNVMVTRDQRPTEGGRRESGKSAQCPGIHLLAHLSPLPALIPASIRVRRELGGEVPSDKHLVALLLQGVCTVPRGPWSMLESGSQEGSDRLAGKLH